MARLIDADKLKAKANADPDSGEGFVWAQDIDEAPTVDAVPVVRCKDCKYYKGFNNACHCHKADKNGTPIFVREDDFCSYGERKNDD